MIDERPLPTTVKAYCILTGRDAHTIGKRVGPDLVVPCVSKANHNHADATPSLRINLAKDNWRCDPCAARGVDGGRSIALAIHSGRARDSKEAEALLCPRDEAQETRSQRRLVATYAYDDADGRPLYEVLRYDPKKFSQRRVFPGGGCDYKLTDVKVPYRLTQMIQGISEGKTVFVVEGERDANNVAALGLVATTSAGGTKWTPVFVEHFRGANHIVVLGDNDKTGRAIAHERAQALAQVCDDVRLIESMPGVPPKGDVSDWLAAGHTREELERLAADAPVVARVAEVASNGESRPTINVTGEDFDVLTRSAIAALVAQNDPPRLFRRAGVIVRIEDDENGMPVCREATVPVLRHEMARAASWERNSQDVAVPVEPKRSIVENVLATPEPPFPILRGIRSAPFFSADGTLVSAFGYTPNSRLYLAMDPGIAALTVNQAPDGAAVREAVGLIDDLIADFPFVDQQADRAHAFALLLLPFIRDMISGPTPLHVADAPTPGTGKTLLLETLLGPGCGIVPVRTLGREDEETRKHLTSILVDGTAACILDNLSGRVQSTSLAAILTGPIWSDRRLGTNSVFTVENKMIWAASANNVSFSTEIARRSVSIRIDANLERPENRSAFRHRLPEYGRKNRRRLIEAACTIIAAWIAAGKPQSSIRPLGSYEAWSEVVGGILECVGIRGFLGNRERLMQTADAEGLEWLTFVEMWFEEYGSDDVTATELVPVAERAGLDLGTLDASTAAKRLGKRLASKRDRIFGGHRIEHRVKPRAANAYRLTPCAPSCTMSVGASTHLYENESEGSIYKSPADMVQHGAHGAAPDGGATYEPTLEELGDPASPHYLLAYARRRLAKPAEASTS